METHNHSQNIPHEVQKTYFQVEGIRCARCIHAIESALKAEPFITRARVNLSTGRLAVEWQGDASLRDKVMQIISALGYRITLFEKPLSRNEEEQFLLRCMAIAGFGMGNIMLVSAALWSSDTEAMGIATRTLFHWLTALIGLPTVLYAGRPYFASAYAVLRKGHTNMDVPISLALILASIMSLYETLRQGEHAYFDSAVMLLFFLLIGRWLDARARGKARETAEGLLAMMQGYATVIEGDTQRSLLISELQENMLLRIAAGEKIPTDAKIIEGHSTLDTSLITGETLPQEVHAGDSVYGGTLNLEAPLVVQVLKPSEQSLLAEIIRLMEQAEQGRAHYVRLADKMARLYTPMVHLVAAATFCGWYFLGGMAWQPALMIAVTTLIITCPCALGLAVPVVQVLASGWLMQRGILLKSGDALERLAAIDTAIFDKTGTLTKGKPELMGTYTEDALQLAASLAAHSKHPYSVALTKAWNGALLPLDAIEEIAGSGLKAYTNHTNIHLGNARWCCVKNPEQAMHYQEAYQHYPQLFLAVEGQTPSVFYFADALREDTISVMQQLHQAGIHTHLLSGDRADVVEAVAKETQINQWHATLSPIEKAHIIHQYQQDGHKVLMVGDGLNDAPSMAKADISISPASAMDITQNSADIVFQGHHLKAVTQAWQMGGFSTRLVKQNFALAMLYNAFAVPLAVAGYVTPLVAAIAMSLSSLVVIANSFRIRFRN